jgi:cyclic pyranopterin phosphate synthase
LDPFKFELITRRRGHEAVLKALDVALRSGMPSVKLNVVVVKGLNDSEVLDFVTLTKDQPISVRFIEFMPFTGAPFRERNHFTRSDTTVREQMGPSQDGSIFRTDSTRSGKVS